MKFLDKMPLKLAIPFTLGLILVVITVLFSRMYLEIFSSQKLSTFEKQNISEIGNRNTIAISYKLSQLEAEYNATCILAKYNDVIFFKGSLIDQKQCKPGFFKLKKSLIIGKTDLITINFLFLMPNELKIGFYIFLFLEILILFAMGFVASKLERDRANGYLIFNTLAKRAAHDIRAPLTALNSLLFNFQMQNDSRTELLHLTIESMNSIAEDLLTFNKISNSVAGAFLEDLIAQLISEKNLVLKNTSKKIAFYFVRESNTLISHKVELYRVLSNIVQNSIEAILSEGSITFKITKSFETINISISDNGSGIPTELMQRLGNQEITTKEFGNGLGLYYAKKTVESLSGQLRISSQQGTGTNIILELPITPPPQEPTNVPNLPQLQSPR